MICFTVGFSQPITINSTTYTVPQLVNNILINSPCISATNITWRTGTDFGSTNGIGFFENTNPTFPIASGVILSTGDIFNSPGPNISKLDDGSALWTGDASLEATLAVAGIPMVSTNATVLEFDFTPISSNFNFEFIFASEEYGNYQCQYSDAFAFLLTNINTGVTTNLAVIPGTSIPISVITIRDFLFNSSCPSANPNFFGRFNGGSNANSSATNFNGQTTVLSAGATLTPNVPYHIKLVIADRLDFQSDSAIFISSESFNIGQDVLGPDLTVANNTALCLGTNYTITTGLNPAQYTFIWKKDDVVLPGETGPSLTVNGPGEYSVIFQNISNTCPPTTNSIIIEYTSQITTPDPINIYRCDVGAANYVFNLDSNTSIVKAGLDPATVVTYYATQADADIAINPLPLQYTATNNTTIFVRIQIPSGCFVVKSFKLLTAPPPVAIQPPDQIKCESAYGVGKAVFNFINLKPTILGTQSASIYTLSFFTSQNDANNNTNPISQTAYFNNITFYNSSNTTIYVRVQNASDPACFSLTSFNLIVNPIPLVDELEDVITCTDYTLQPLVNGNYFSAPDGGGTPMFAGDVITETQTIYIYNQPGGPGTCAASSSFNVIIIIVNELAPGNVTACDFYVVPAVTNGNFYTQSGGNGSIVPSGTIIGLSQTVFFYFSLEDAVIPCIVDSSFQVTILPSINLAPIADVFDCSSYTLPPLTIGKYYSLSGGLGAEILVGTTITTTQTIYVYATTGGTSPCITEISFRVTIGIDAPANINQCNGYELPVLPVGQYFTGPAGTGTMIPAGTFIETDSIIYIYQPTTSGQNSSCIDNLSFTLTFRQPIVIVLPNITVCEYYTLPPLAHGNYFTESYGAGNLLQPGDQIATTQTIYIFERLDATCANESSFTVTVLGIPLIDSRADIDICDQYVLTELNIGQYYTGPNGTGSLLPAETVITESQLIYIYDISNSTPPCPAQNSFQITIFKTTTDDLDDVVACDSYILPQLLIDDSNYYTDTGGIYGTGVVIPEGTLITTSQTIFIFKEEIIRADFKCTAETSFNITINSTPILAPIPDINGCESINLPALTIGNYFTEQNGGGTMIPAGTSITIPQTIYAFVNTNTTPDCFTERSFEVNVINVDEVPDATICESFTLPILTLGKYYTGSNGTGTQLYAGNTISTSQTIYVFLQSNFLPVCSDESSFDITIVEVPFANNVPAALRTICDQDGTNDGNYLFDFSTLTSTVLGSQTGTEFTVAYYESLANAQSETNPVTASTASPIFVRVNNTLTTDCYDILSFPIIVNKLPVPTPVDGYVCIDFDSGVLLSSYTMYSNLSSSLHFFQWTDQTNQVVGTSSSYTALAAGVYTIVATHKITGCVSDPVQVIVQQSEPAEVTYLVIDDFWDNQSIIVTATGFGGDYVYSLDGGPYQISNVFEDVSSGIHIIRVKDNNGCNTTTVEALVIKYPKFFTPNGDGYNETWNIRDLQANLDARIVIFDRYGKIISEIKPSGAGWDGTYNGRMMFSTDYWFIVYYKNINNVDREFRAHFSLKR